MCSPPARASSKTPARCSRRAKPDVVHIVTPPAHARGARRARARGRLPRLRREAVHADASRGRSAPRARRRTRRSRSAPATSACSSGRRCSRSRCSLDRPRRPRRELLLVPEGAADDHARSIRRTTSCRTRCIRWSSSCAPGAGLHRRAGRAHRAGRAAERRRLRAAPARRLHRHAHRDAERAADRAVPAHRRHQRIAARRLRHRIGHAARRVPGPGPGVLLTPYRRAFQTHHGRDERIRVAHLRRARLVSRPADARRALLRQHRRRRSVAAVAAVDPRHRRRLRAHRRARSPRRSAHARRGAQALLASAVGDAAAASTARRDRARHRRHRAAWAGGSSRNCATPGSRSASLARRLPPWSARVPGVEYVAADLARAARRRRS